MAIPKPLTDEEKADLGRLDLSGSGIVRMEVTIRAMPGPDGVQFIVFGQHYRPVDPGDMQPEGVIEVVRDMNLFENTGVIFDACKAVFGHIAYERVIATPEPPSGPKILTLGGPG